MHRKQVKVGKIKKIDNEYLIPVFINGKYSTIYSEYASNKKEAVNVREKLLKEYRNNINYTVK